MFTLNRLLITLHRHVAVYFQLPGKILETHSAVIDQLSSLIHLIINREKESFSEDKIEEMIEIYLVLGAILQRTYQVKIKA